VSATECANSATIEPEPVIKKPISLAAATPMLATSATATARNPAWLAP
jgi:hypothetical protein